MDFALKENESTGLWYNVLTKLGEYEVDNVDVNTGGIRLLFRGMWG